MPRAAHEQVPRSLGIVLRDVGGLLFLIGALMVIPALVAAVYGELYSGLSFLASSGITVASGYLLYRGFQGAGEPKLRHAMVTAGAGWLSVALFGALPYLLAAWWTPSQIVASHVPASADYVSSLYYFRDPLNAVFEAMSGYTTTGLTMTVHEPSLSHSLLLYRSLTQWIGGAGVVVLALAVLRQGGGAGSYSLYKSEARQQRVRPSIVATARSIAVVYAALTALVAAYLASALFVLQPDYGLANTIFDAVNHAMTGQATGGFSVLDDSIAGYGSYALELVHMLPMILGAIALPLYYLAFNDRDPRVFTQDPQVRTMFVLIVLGGPALVYLLSQVTFPFPEVAWTSLAGLREIARSPAVREGAFQWISGLTGTGWQTTDIGIWSAAPIMLLVLFGMNIQGSAGSTTGGIKLIRGYLLAKALRWKIHGAFLPENAIQTVRTTKRTLDADEAGKEFGEAGLLAIAYGLFFALGTLLYLGVEPGLALKDVAFEVASAQGTVGLSAGLTGPAMNTTAKTSFVFLMWLGRLEIFPVLALIRAVSFGMKFR